MVTKKDVEALNAPATPTVEDASAPPMAPDDGPMSVKFVDVPDRPTPEGTPFLSEGMRHDILRDGFAYDPLTGGRVERA